MSTEDIRWIQRLNSYRKALQQLTEFIEKGNLNKFEKQGMIKAFEYTYELAWNTMKDFFEDQGETGLAGSRDVIRLAFRRELIEDGKTWMDMIKNRALTVHTYNQEAIEEIAAVIEARYYAEFIALSDKLQAIRDREI